MNEKKTEEKEILIDKASANDISHDFHVGQRHFTIDFALSFKLILFNAPIDNQN